MKIGLFTDAYYPIISGVSLSVHTLANELIKLGHDVTIITNDHEHAETEKQVLRLGGYRLPMKGLKEYRIGKVTRRKIREIAALNLDIIHCHTEFTMGRLGRKAARKFNIPVVHTYHTMYEDYVHFISKTLVVPLRIASKYYSRSFANSSDAVIFPTIKVKRTFERYGYKKSGHIIPTGIYLEQFRKINYSNHELQVKRQELGFKDDDFVCLFLGRLSREKSIEDLICEFAKIDNNKVYLLLVGGGPDQDLFKQNAEKCGIADRVVFTGMVQPRDVGFYYHLADLFVNFSTTETQGLTYIEALSSGLPLLVKYDDNLEGVVSNGINGFTFDTNDEFASLFQKIYKDSILYNKLQHNANKTMAKFSAQQYAINVAEVYKSLLKG
jgi:1,2-diacylglycerol 3-alpha-glucosyltransferase